MQEFRVLDRQFGLSESKYVMLSYSKRFLIKIEKIENQVHVNKVRPSGPYFSAFPADLEGSLLINAQGGRGPVVSQYNNFNVISKKF